MSSSSVPPSPGAAASASTLRTRIVTGVILIAGFACALAFASAQVWRMLTLAIMLYAAWEWSAFAKLDTMLRAAYVALVAVLGSVLLAHALGEENASVGEVWLPWFLLAAVFWIAIATLWLWRGWAPHSRALLAVVGLVVLIPTWLAMVALRELSAYVLLMVMALVWVADSAAYFVGRRYGKHKLAPSISPGKSWEGVLGAVAGVAIYLMLCLLIVLVTRPSGASLPLPFFVVVVFGAPLTAVSILGDLFESSMKRMAGLKDSGNLLPGHGGVLDRIDALTSTLPLAAAVIFTAQRWHLA